MGVTVNGGGDLGVVVVGGFCFDVLAEFVVGDEVEGIPILADGFGAKVGEAPRRFARSRMTARLYLGSP